MRLYVCVYLCMKSLTTTLVKIYQTHFCWYRIHPGYHLLEMGWVILLKWHTCALGGWLACSVRAEVCCVVCRDTGCCICTCETSSVWKHSTVERMRLARWGSLWGSVLTWPLIAESSALCPTRCPSPAEANVYLLFSWALKSQQPDQLSEAAIGSLSIARWGCLHHRDWTTLTSTLVHTAPTHSPRPVPPCCAFPCQWGLMIIRLWADTCSTLLSV